MKEEPRFAVVPHGARWAVQNLRTKQRFLCPDSKTAHRLAEQLNAITRSATGDNNDD